MASAGGAAAIPIPFSDATLLVPIQLGMMAKIAQLYKIKFDRAALMAIASTTAATQVGRATFTGLLKLVPGAGTVVGGVIGAGVASTLHLRHGSGLAEGLPAGRGQGSFGGVDGALDNEAAPGRVPGRVQVAPAQDHRRGETRSVGLTRPHDRQPPRIGLPPPRAA